MSQQQDQQHMHGERRHVQTQFQGDERRQPMSFGETAAPDESARTNEMDSKKYSDEMPPDPTPGDPGREARVREKIELQRAAERDLSDRVRPHDEDAEPAP